MLTNEVLGLIKTAPEIEMHELLTVDRLVNSPGFPIERYSNTVEHFYDLAANAIATEVDARDDYALTPLTVIKSKDHPLAAALADAISLNLKHFSAAQESDGSWART